ncbi:MAG: hypothetical protein JXA75_02900 [Candidatus Thermoplasmatota archaeon]|nr:hypothetical protein [Candidatus Thermoplasmatota archaeon]
MVRERKTRGKDIEKIHELIDSASVQKRKTTSLTKEEQLQLIRKHLANESLKNQKQVTPFEKPHTTSENLTPQVVVRNKQETKKKEEKVIQIDLGPRKIIKEEEPAAVKSILIQEDVFAHEPLFEIEKVEIPMQEFTEIRAGTSLKESEDPLAPLPETPVRKEIQEHLPEFQPVPEGALFPEAARRMKWKKPKAFYQRSQRINDEQTSSPISFQEEERQNPSFEAGEFQPLVEERKEPMRFEMQNKELDSCKQKKIEEKQHEKLKEREAKHLAKEQEKRLKIETLKSHQKKQEEQQRKNWELRQAFAQAEEQEREEQRLLKEQEKKSRLEIIERQHKEKEQRRQKKVEERKARLEIKEKKREAKRLAKEHDRKLKLEWIEFQHQQRQKQKQEELEKRKAAVEAKQKEQEEQRLVQEREEKLRLEHIQLMRKEKEERERKKLEEKPLKQLAKEQEKRLKIETLEAEKQKSLQQKQAAAYAEKQALEEQRLLKEMEEKSRLELLERQEKEKEKQRSILAKKEKKTFVFPLSEKKKPVEEITDGVPWESFQEDTKREPGHQDSLQTEEPTSTETQKQLLKEKKRQQKQLEREQKKRAQQERLEVKKKEKEEKKQREIEEKQRSHLFGFSKENKEMWQGKNEGETFSKREAASKERDEKRRLKEEQKRKERASAIEEVEQKKKEKNEKKLKDFDQKKERRQISMLSFGKGNDTEVIDEQKQAEQQRQTMDLVRIAAEERDLRKTRALERKMKKEQRKNEKVEQKYKMKEEDNARKKMNLHMQEEIMKEKLTNNQLERNDPFVAFDSIDPETANILDHYGYSSVEKLRQATVKDLLKTGLKKKTAQRIIAECGEFVEWQVFDSIDHF